MTKKILCLSRYNDLGASSRLRFFQYIDTNDFDSFDIELAPFFSNNYLTRMYNGSSTDYMDILNSYLKRLYTCLTFSKYDVIWIEKEILPLMPAFIERLCNVFGVKYVVDYDDAVFHNYDMSPNFFLRTMLRNKIDVVMKNASYVVAGNPYIFERAKSAGAVNVIQIPTVIDTNRYGKSDISNPTFTIGWMGTPSTQKYVVNISAQLTNICLKFGARLLLVGANRSIAEHFPSDILEVLTWEESREVEFIKMFDIGIMPLHDGPWEKGKCGYKLIQYLGCGVPALASDVGVNRDILNNTEGGVLVENDNEWEDKLSQLICNPNLIAQFGEQGAVLVDKYYSLKSQSKLLASILRGER